MGYGIGVVEGGMRPLSESYYNPNRLHTVAGNCPRYLGGDLKYWLGERHDVSMVFQLGKRGRQIGPDIRKINPNAVVCQLKESEISAMKPKLFDIGFRHGIIGDEELLRKILKSALHGLKPGGLFFCDGIIVPEDQLRVVIDDLNSGGVDSVQSVKRQPFGGVVESIGLVIRKPIQTELEQTT